MRLPVSNADRFLMIVFVLWCQQHGKDHTKEDFEQVLHIPGPERDTLDELAHYAVVKSGHCSSCWEVLPEGWRTDCIEITLPGIGNFTCPACGSRMTMNGNTKRGKTID